MTKCDITLRTEEAFGKPFFDILQKYTYCIAGCGGTGSLFAEMLVRTGMKKIILIDGDKVELHNLNRSLSFLPKDKGKKKVEVLKSRLESICPDVEVTPVDDYLTTESRQQTKEALKLSDVVIIGIDNHEDRKNCEKLCSKFQIRRVISVGIGTEPNFNAIYECAWKPQTPEECNESGYGHGSYAAIVMEATSVVFSMMLHNLKNEPDSGYRYICREYKNFIPSTKPPE